MNNLRPETENAPLPSLGFVELKTEINVLIVDESESDRAIYSRYLQSESENIYCIIEAATLKEGLELWRSQQPNIVLMDLNLPDGNGLEFLEAINVDRAEDRVPVIMLTGQGNEKMAVSAMKLGAFDCLVKGDITAKSLTTTIKQALRETMLSRQLLRSQQQQILISEIALRIREFTDLEDISNAIVKEVRQFINADRAVIYKFNPDMSGKIVAEDIVSPWQPSLDVQVQDTCFRENLGGAYCEGRIFVANDIYAANLTACHIKLLERFQVRANLVVPILLPNVDKHILWGLLILHQCSAPRIWEESDIQLLQRLSVKLAIAIQQAIAEQELLQLNQSLEAKVIERTQAIQLQSQMLEQIHDAVISTTIDGTIQTWNIGAERLYGYKSNEAIGQNVSMLYLEEDIPIIEHEVFSPLMEKGDHETELRNRTKSGTIIYISLRLSLVRDALGNPIRLIGCSNNISDRKQIELQLRQLNQELENRVERRTVALKLSESRLQEAQQVARLGNWELDVLANEIIISRELFAIMGINSEEAKCNFDQVSAYFPNQDNEIRLALVKRAIEYGESFEVDLQFIRTDGTIGSILKRGRVDFNEAGEVTRLFGIVMDISDRKQAEETLRESEELKRRILESSSDCIKLIDLDGRLLYVNDGGLAILEIDDFSLVCNANWIALWPEASHSDIEAAIALAKSGQTGKFQGFCPTAKGNPKWWDVVVTPIRDGNEKVVQMLSVSRDISDRKQAEQEILEKQQFIQQIADSSPNVLYLYDIQEQRNVYANREVLTTLGYSLVEIQEMGEAWLLTVIHPDDMLPTLEHWERLKQANDNEAFSHEYRFRHANGEWRYLLSRDLVFSRDVQGQVKLIIGTAQDITERKQAEAKQQQLNEEILRATKLKDEFLANMSHELRTPLNAILGLSNALGEQILGSLNERQLKSIGTVESSGEHLLSLINDILDLSKISSGMMELTIESVSAKNLCDSSLVFVKQQAFQKKVQINSIIPNNINKINVEERRIRQVLINLLTNAVKFTPSEGKVSLLVAVGQGNTWQGEAKIPQQFRIQNSPMIVFQPTFRS